ncbi:MAG TPA: hypothetical protein VFE05_11790 [Longimicrobiaceae bacterium]|jgi:hypothetical protein|nr:hypothetical protein [Longimicrobiaceae bacterium]
MEQYKLDTDFTVETFDPAVEVARSVAVMKCTGCPSGCGIFPEPSLDTA